jgi:hypothetical protein
MAKKRDIFRELIRSAAAMARRTDKINESEIEPSESAQIRAQGSIRRLRGKVKWEGDLDQSRRSRI